MKNRPIIEQRAESREQSNLYSNLVAYSGYFNNTEKLLKSSSGGGATALSEAIIREGGVVFGVCYSQDFKSAEFTCIEREEDLYKLKGSKYIETNKRIFHDGEYKPLWPFVAEKLTSGKKVLFIGLGCDVAALKSFLKVKEINTSNLFTVDLICFGPTSPEVHKQYVEYLEKKYNSKITSFTVRGKKRGWVPPYIIAEFENGKKFFNNFYHSDYGRAFNISARQSCYSCFFKGSAHQADITLGDYWGLTKNMSGYNHNGVSIFILHTSKGQELIKKINNEDFSLQPTDVDFAVKNNPMFCSCRKNKEASKKFFEDLKILGLHKAVLKNYGYKRIIRGFIPATVKKAIKLILGKK